MADATLTQGELDAQNAATGQSQFNSGPAKVGGSIGNESPIMPPVSQTQDAGSINNQISGNTQGVIFPQAPSGPTTATSNNTSVPNPIPTAADIVSQGTQDTPAGQTNSTLLQKIADFIGQKKGQTEFTNTSEESAGVPALTKTVNDLNTQLEGLNNQALDLQNQAAPGGAIENTNQQNALGRGITAGGLAPLTASDLRMNQIKQAAIASQALTLKSAIYGAQGKLTLAKDAADKAATAQFEHQQNQIDYMNSLVAANAPAMNKQEKAQADLVTQNLADRQRKLDQAKDDKKSIIALATAALKNFPNDTAAHYAAQQALAESNKEQPNLEVVLGLIGKYQSDPVAAQQAILNLTKTRAEITKLNADIKAANPGLGSITNANAAPYSAALANILGSGKFTKDQKSSLIQAINGGEDAFVTIKNQAKNIMGQTEATKLTSYEAADSAMRDLSTKIQAYYDAGGDTGLLSGSFEKAINKLGNVKDPKKVEIATQVAISLQAYRNAISGTAYSNQEGQQIESVFPGINKSQGLNTAIIKGRLAADESIIDGIYGTALGQKTYGDLKAAQKAPVQGGTAPKTGKLKDGTVVTQNADGSITDAKGNKYDKDGNKLK